MEINLIFDFVGRRWLVKRFYKYKTFESYRSIGSFLYRDNTFTYRMNETGMSKGLTAKELEQISAKLRELNNNS